MVEISQNFVAFSEYMNLLKIYTLLNHEGSESKENLNEKPSLMLKLSLST